MFIRPEKNELVLALLERLWIEYYGFYIKKQLEFYDVIVEKEVDKETGETKFEEY